jgi:uncharacterized Zn-finger protein
MVMTKAVLDSHMHIVHGAEKSITCEECGAMFSNSGSLKTHMYMKHPTERQRRICPHCGAEFNYMDYYTHLKTAHADIHGPRKTHACPLCGKEYRIPKKLKNHMASVHKVRRVNCHAPSTCCFWSLVFSNDMMEIVLGFECKGLLG